MDRPSLLLNSAALVFSLMAIIVALRQARIMQHANLLPILTEMFNDFRSAEFKQHIAYITTELQTYPRDTAVDDLPEVARNHIGPVVDYFNTIGVLVANRLVSDLLIASYMGRSVLRAWYYSEPYIRKERARRKDPEWNMFFENLAYVVRQVGRSTVLTTKLKLKSMEESTSIPDDLRPDTTREL
jgi:predicted DNA binding protein